MSFKDFQNKISEKIKTITPQQAAAGVVIAAAIVGTGIAIKKFMKLGEKEKKNGKIPFDK